jgi:hypothetical protein
MNEEEKPLETEVNTSNPEISTSNVETTPEKQPNTPTVEQTNWREVRAQQEASRREVEELRRMIAQQNQPQVPVQKEVDISDDDIPDGRHINQVKAQVKELKAELQATRVRAEYPDYAQVVTQKAIERLIAEEPEFAASIESNKNTYSQAVATYKAIKKFGLNETVDIEKAMFDKNVTKPRPTTVTNNKDGATPLGHVAAWNNGFLSDEAKEMKWKEMKRDLGWN